jgi:hypothetical protein
MTLVQNPLETLDYVTAATVSSPSAETAIVTTDTIQAYANPADQQPGTEQVSPQVVRPVKVEINMNITTGTAATALVIRVRQGTGVSGTVIGPGAQTITVAAATTYQLAFVFRDTSGVPFAPGGTTYTVTVAETSASAAGTVTTIDTEVKQ